MAEKLRIISGEHAADRSDFSSKDPFAKPCRNAAQTNGRGNEALTIAVGSRSDLLSRRIARSASHATAVPVVAIACAQAMDMTRAAPIAAFAGMLGDVATFLAEKRRFCRS
jgi:hypothetical protein